MPNGVSARVWMGVGHKGFVFPEIRDGTDGVEALKAKPDFAISISGGGFRATTLALGWIRALSGMGVLMKARYLCSNSGGSWFNVAFSFQADVQNDLFLGHYAPPEQLTPQRLVDHPQGSYARVIDRATLKNQWFYNLVVDAVTFDFSGRAPVRAWTRAIGKAFLKPYGLSNRRDTFALAGASERRAEASKTARKVRTAMRRDEMPFPIVVGCAMPSGDRRVFYSFEMTPLYCGVPASIDDSTPIRLGGLLVEPFALPSYAPDDGERQRLAAAGSEAQSVKLRPKGPLSPVLAAGISSQYIAQVHGDSGNRQHWELLGCPELPFFSGADLASYKMPFGDGGGTDNLAVFPPLRRGVAKMLILCANGRPPEDDWARKATDVSSYFGRVPADRAISTGSGDIDAATFNASQQVFEAKEFDDMLNTIQRQYRDGVALIWAKQLWVLPNRTQGVSGGYLVDTVWIFNGGAPEWKRHLPSATLREVQRIQDFPYIPTDNLDYEPELTGALSMLGAYNIAQAQRQISRLLTGGVLDDLVHAAERGLHKLGAKSAPAVIRGGKKSKRRTKPDTE